MTPSTVLSYRGFFQTGHRTLVNVADSKISVQRFLESQRILTGITNGQCQFKLPADGDPVLQVGREREEQLDDAVRALCGGNQIPFRQARGAVRGCRGVGGMGAEPGKDDRDTATNCFPRFGATLLAHEQDRAVAVRLKEGHMGAMAIDSGGGVRAGHLEAGEVAEAGFLFHTIR